MKIIRQELFRALATAVTAAICLQAVSASAQAGEKAAAAEFPYVIPPELGATEFLPGDRIVITSVRGNREHFEAGGTYVVEGSYTLASEDSAHLSWIATTRHSSGGTPITKTEQITVARGSSTFHLEKTLLGDGWLHITFYVKGHAHGGIYFGEKGFENTILRTKGWSDFTDESRGRKPGTKTAASHNGGSADSGANLAIMTYLGDPIAPPAVLDAKYAPTNLLAAFTTLIKKQAWQINQVTVDDSEFPFLVYGVLGGKCDYHVLAEGLRQMNGYDYGGSVVGSTDAGRTYFSLNMIPRDHFPDGQAEACNRRLMVRLQMLADKVRQAE